MISRLTELARSTRLPSRPVMLRDKEKPAWQQGWDMISRHKFAEGSNKEHLNSASDRIEQHDT
jgi:hypothetical protein